MNASPAATSTPSRSGSGWFSSFLSKAKNVVTGATGALTTPTSNPTPGSRQGITGTTPAVSGTRERSADLASSDLNEDAFVEIDRQFASEAAANGRQRPQQVHYEALQLRALEQELLTDLNFLCSRELNVSDILGILADAPKPFKCNPSFPDAQPGSVPPDCMFSSRETQSKLTGEVTSTSKPNLISGGALLETASAGDPRSLHVIDATPPNPALEYDSQITLDSKASAFYPEILPVFAAHDGFLTAQTPSNESSNNESKHTSAAPHTDVASSLEGLNLEFVTDAQDFSFESGSLEADHVLWTLRAIANSILSPSGAHIAPELYIPSHFWLLPNLKIAAHSLKLKSLGTITQTLKLVKSEFASLQAAYPACIDFFRVVPRDAPSTTTLSTPTGGKNGSHVVRWIDMLTVCSRMASVLSEVDQQFTALRKSLAFEIMAIPKVAPPLASPQHDPSTTVVESSSSTLDVGSKFGASATRVIPFPGMLGSQELQTQQLAAVSSVMTDGEGHTAQMGRFTPYVDIEQWEQVALARTHARAKSISEQAKLPPPSIFSYLLPEASLIPSPWRNADAAHTNQEISTPSWAPTLMSTVIRASTSSLAVRQATQHAQLEMQAKRSGGFFGRVKALAYSAVQEASRVGKNVLPSRLNAEEAIVYMRALVDTCTAAQELRTLYRDIGHIVSPPSFVAAPRSLASVYVDSETVAALWTAQIANRAIDTEAIIAAMNRQKQLQKAVVGGMVDQGSQDSSAGSPVPEVKASTAHRQTLEHAASTRLGRLSQHYPGVSFEEIRGLCLVPELELNEDNVSDAHSVHCLAQEIRFRLDRIVKFLKEALLAFVLDDLRRNAEGFLEVQQQALFGSD